MKVLKKRFNKLALVLVVAMLASVAPTALLAYYEFEFTLPHEPEEIRLPYWAEDFDIYGEPIGLVSEWVELREQLEDGEYFVEVDRLPRGIYTAETVLVYYNEFELEFLITDYVRTGEFELVISLLDEYGDLVYEIDQLWLVINETEYVEVDTLPIEVDPDDEPWTTLPIEVDPIAPPPVQPPTGPEIQPPIPIPPGPTVIRLVIGSPVYTVHGQNVTDSEGLMPFIDEDADRTMVPLRLVGEILGAEVTWAEATNSVIIELDEEIMVMQIGVPLPEGMGMPAIVNERTFVPVSYVSTFFGAEVRWDEGAQAVYITR